MECASRPTRLAPLPRSPTARYDIPRWWRGWVKIKSKMWREDGAMEKLNRGFTVEENYSIHGNLGGACSKHDVLACACVMTVL